MAVNLSSHQFNKGELSSVVSAALVESKLTPDLLDLELTETLIIADPAKATEILDDCKALGVRISMDDFGTGYSSLSMLKRLESSLLVNNSSAYATRGWDTLYFICPDGLLQFLQLLLPKFFEARQFVSARRQVLRRQRS